MSKSKMPLDPFQEYRACELAPKRSVGEANVAESWQTDGRVPMLGLRQKVPRIGEVTPRPRKATLGSGAFPAPKFSDVGGLSTTRIQSGNRPVLSEAKEQSGAPAACLSAVCLCAVVSSLGLVHCTTISGCGFRLLVAARCPTALHKYSTPLKSERERTCNPPEEMNRFT